jgi:membrane protease YdiL (CAAX protease family)
MSPTVSHGRKRGEPKYGPPDAPYWSASTTPLHVLVFLMPLIVFYEVGSWMWLRGGDTIEEIKARWLLGRVFEAFGVHGLWMPPVLLVIVLLVWQFLLHARWRVRPGVVVGMGLESLAWAVPLIVLGQLLYQLLVGDRGPALAATVPAPVGGDPVLSLGLGARATIAIGAGLYEEMVFRMLAIALVHGLVHDVIGFSDKVGRIAAVVASAAAFALYHDAGAGAGGIDASALMYYFVAGLYFGVLYLLRGLGITVGAHAAYDLAVLLLRGG